MWAELNTGTFIDVATYTQYLHRKGKCKGCFHLCFPGNIFFSVFHGFQSDTSFTVYDRDYFCLAFFSFLKKF